MNYFRFSRVRTLTPPTPSRSPSSSSESSVEDGNFEERDEDIEISLDFIDREYSQKYENLVNKGSKRSDRNQGLDLEEIRGILKDSKSEDQI